MSEEVKTIHKVEPARVNKDDLMAFIYYAKVTDVRRQGAELLVENIDNKQPFSVIGAELVSGALSADQYAEEVKVTKTRAAEILTSSHNRPLTVIFIKQDGSERKLRGRLVSTEPLLGRSYCEDLDLPREERKGSRLRLVDHRTIASLIVDGTKYVVK